MNDADAHPQEPQQHVINLSGSAGTGDLTVSTSVTLTVIPADNIEVEDSPTLRYLPLKNGNFSLPKRVFLVMDGERHEITFEMPSEE